jgi:outer membrane protein assembly factor BamB
VPQKIGDDYTYAQICGLTLGNDGALYAAHCGPGDHVRKAFCINPDGSMRWAADYNGVKTMVIDKNGELAMARDASWFDWDAGVWHNHYPISCIDAGTGDLIWDREIEGGQSVSVIIAENGDYICQYTIGTVGEMDRIVRLNPSNGDILWSAECWSGTSLLGSSDEIFVRHPNHGIQRINGQDGSLIQSDYGGSVPSIDADGYLHTFRNTSPAIDRLSVVQVDGSLVRETTLDHGGGISPAISKCDIIYLAAGQHIYAIQGEAALEAGQYWPRSTHDNRNTNNSNIDISIK